MRRTTWSHPKLTLVVVAACTIGLIGASSFRGDKAYAGTPAEVTEWTVVEAQAYLFWIVDGAPGLERDAKVSLDRNSVSERHLQLAQTHAEEVSASRKRLSAEMEKANDEMEEMLEAESKEFESLKERLKELK